MKFSMLAALLLTFVLRPDVASAQGTTHFRHLAEGGEEQMIITCNESHRCDIEKVLVAPLPRTRECVIIRESWQAVVFRRHGSGWIGRARRPDQRWEFRVDFADATPTSLVVVSHNTFSSTSTRTFELAPSAAFDTRGCDSVSGIWPEVAR